MKRKITAIILLLAVAVCSVALLASCSDDISTNEPTTTTPDSSATALTSAESVINQTTTENVAETTKSSDIGGGVATLDKYRARYYDVPAPFSDLIGGDEKTCAWLKKVCAVDPNDTNVMVMVRFIQDFDISREDFDRANAELAAGVKNNLGGIPVVNPQDFANQEFDEIFNADIIYTFDNEVINAYYLSHDYPFVYESDYEKAIEDGTYKTRTAREDFFYPEDYR